jgi:hypothetical protein
MNVSQTFPCSSFLHYLCSVIQIIEYFAVDIRRLLHLDKTSFAVSMYVKKRRVALIMLIIAIN